MITLFTYWCNCFITSPKIRLSLCSNASGMRVMMTSSNEKHFPRHWPFVRGIHRSPMNSRTKPNDAELWCFLWFAPWINGWVKNREASDLGRHRAHYYVIVVIKSMLFVIFRRSKIYTYLTRSKLKCCKFESVPDRWIDKGYKTLTYWSRGGWLKYVYPKWFLMSLLIWEW